MKSDTEKLLRKIEERRNDPEFVARLRALMDQEEELLDRLQHGVDPERLVVTYGERSRGQLGYILVERGSLGRPNTPVFQSNLKSEVIAEAQRRKGWKPVDGSEITYAMQINEHAGESR